MIAKNNAKKKSFASLRTQQYYMLAMQRYSRKKDCWRPREVLQKLPNRSMIHHKMRITGLNDPGITIKDRWHNRSAQSCIMFCSMKQFRCFSLGNELLSLLRRWKNCQLRPAQMQSFYHLFKQEEVSAEEQSLAFISVYSTVEIPCIQSKICLKRILNEH